MSCVREEETEAIADIHMALYHCNSIVVIMVHNETDRSAPKWPPFHGKSMHDANALCIQWFNGNLALPEMHLYIQN